MESMLSEDHNRCAATTHGKDVPLHMRSFARTACPRVHGERSLACRGEAGRRRQADTKNNRRYDHPSGRVKGLYQCAQHTIEDAGGHSDSHRCAPAPDFRRASPIKFRVPVQAIGEYETAALHMHRTASQGLCYVRDDANIFKHIQDHTCNFWDVPRSDRRPCAVFGSA